MTISGERTKQLDIFCRITGFTSDFLSFIVVEFIWFFHGALQLFPWMSLNNYGSVINDQKRCQFWDTKCRKVSIVES